MKNNLYTLIFFMLLSCVLSAQTGNIRFTLVKSPTQENQVLIKAKNIAGNNISGVLGASNLTLCLTYPKTLTGLSIDISSPIANQSFATPLKTVLGQDSVITWNGLGSTAIINFASNTEVTLAAVTFNGGALGVTSTIKLACLANSGPSGFDYCYIAPGGTEQSGYSNPFYSNVASDPLLANCGGANSTENMCTSTIGIANIALPVKFLSFIALKSDDDAKLSWTVENDEDNKYFEIERSFDGRSFKTMAKVDAMANGKSVNTYEALDARLSGLGANTIYYRVKQIDKSGNSLYSSVRNLNTTRSNTPVQIFPNPAKTTTKLLFDAANSGRGTVLVRDMQGKLVLQFNTQYIKGVNQQDINVSALASGDYNLSVLGEGFTHNAKLTKIN